MKTINIHEAKTHLSRLVETVATTQEPIIIAKAGKPRVQIIPLDKPLKKRQMGTLKGKLTVPDDFDRWYEKKLPNCLAGSHPTMKVLCDTHVLLWYLLGETQRFSPLTQDTVM